MVCNRPYVIVCVLAFAFLLKASLFFEIDMIHAPAECANMIQKLGEIKNDSLRFINFCLVKFQFGFRTMP